MGRCACGRVYQARNYHPEFNYGEFALIKSKVGFYHSIHLHISKEGEIRRLSQVTGFASFRNTITEANITNRYKKSNASERIASKRIFHLHKCGI